MLGDGGAELGELLGDPDRRGAAAAVAGGHRALDGEHVADPGGQVRRDRGELLVGQVRQLDAELLAAPHAGAGDLVGDPERHALADQPLGDVGGEREALRGELGHPLGVEGQRRDHAGEGGQQHLEGVDGVEDRLLVLLQVAVVGQRQRLEGGQQPGEVADQAAGLAAGELGDVGVLLLRHDARPGGVAVVERARSRTPWSPRG